MFHYFRFSFMRGNRKSCSIVLSVLTQLTIMHLNSTQRVVAQLHCQIHNKVQRNPSNELLQVNSSQFETMNSGQFDRNTSSVRLLRGIMANFYKSLMVYMSLRS